MYEFDVLALIAFIMAALNFVEKDMASCASFSAISLAFVYLGA